MRGVWRPTGAIIVGIVIWAALWLSGTSLAQGMFPGVLREGQPIIHFGALVGLIAYSVVLSLLAGRVTAATAGNRFMPAVWVFAVIQLVFGVIAEVGAWGLMPVWYHLVFLALVVPATVLGGRLRSSAA